MKIEFGSQEALIILAKDKYNENNTLENFTAVLFEDVMDIEHNSDNFDYDKVIDLLEQYETNKDKIKEGPGLFLEVLNDAQYFIKGLRDIAQQIENWQKTQ